jgi:hypothetical protein
MGRERPEPVLSHLLRQGYDGLPTTPVFLYVLRKQTSDSQDAVIPGWFDREHPLDLEVWQEQAAQPALRNPMPKLPFPWRADMTLTCIDTSVLSREDQVSVTVQQVIHQLHKPWLIDNVSEGFQANDDIEVT